MAFNNLRLIYNNLIDITSTTLLASSQASPSVAISSVRSDIKSAVWRTTIGIKSAIIIVSMPTAAPIDGVVLPYTNFSSTAIIKIQGYSGSAASFAPESTEAVPVVTATGPLFDSGAQLAAQYLSQGSGYLLPGQLPSQLEAQHKPYARVWLSPENVLASAAAKTYVITITDTNNLDNYLEVSRLVLGKYWSPVFNTSFGVSLGVKDLTASERSEAGDLITSAAPSYKVLNFDLKYMTKEDRQEFNKVIRTVGTKKPVFVSVFPDNSSDYEEEQTYQLYGKFTQLFGITNHIYTMYNTQIEMEEV